MTIPSRTQAVRGSLNVSSSDAYIEQTIKFQYNPMEMTRTITPTYAKKPGNDDGLSFGTQAAGQSISMKLMIQAVDNMWAGAVESDGLLPTLAILEAQCNASTSALDTWNSDLDQGIATVPPLPAPTLILQLGARCWPVKITSLTISEKAFDQSLVPVEAEVTAAFAVVTYDEVLKDSSIYTSYQNHHTKQESYASSFTAPTEGA